MDFTLTIVSASTALSAGHLATIEKFTEEEKLLMTGNPVWLEPHKAADIPLAECLNMDQMLKLRALMADEKIDVFCTRTENRRKKLLIADMDSTIVTTETLDELAEEAGIKQKVSEITDRAMRGELDFHEALRERVGLLKGLSVNSLKRTLDQTEISIGAQALVASMRQDGAFCALVSGGFTYFTSAVASKLGFTVNHGNILNINNDELSGTVGEPILDKDSKLEFLHQYCTELDINISDSVAIGDGANDLPMLEAAGLGIGYHPKPILEKTLLNCIRFTDLTSVLYIQGYRSKEIS